jgi:K+-transporting ATPase KdpF subunit
MPVFYVVGAAVSVALFFYLLFAMLLPEKLS